MLRHATVCTLLLLLATPAPAEPARAGAAGLDASAAAAIPPAAPDAARAPVEALHSTLLQVMQQADALGFAGRYRTLEPVVAEAYDLDFMAAKSLGRAWEQLSEAQRQRWRDAFRKLTISTYAGRFDGYGGERFEIVASEPSIQRSVLVHTLLHVTDGAPVALDYRLRPTAPGFRIIDVYLEGTVSELALRRSDYSSRLKREGFESLMQAIAKKIAEAEAGKGSESP